MTATIALLAGFSTIVASASEMPRCQSLSADHVLEIYGDGASELHIEDISCKPTRDPSTRAFIQACQVETSDSRRFSVVMDLQCDELITISELQTR